MFAIINNAGAATFGSLTEMEESEFKLVFDVNVFGPYRITRSFLPLLKATKGRVINIGSIAGLFSQPMKGAYCMSKHALEAYSDALRHELAPYDVKVILVEPGSFKSKMGKTVMDRLKKKGSIENNPVNTEITSLKEPDEIIDTIIKAIESKNPKLRYMIPSDASEAEFTIRSVANRLAQVNSNHQYSYSKEELIEILEQEMDQTSPQ